MVDTSILTDNPLTVSGESSTVPQQSRREVAEQRISDLLTVRSFVLATHSDRLLGEFNKRYIAALVAVERLYG